MGLRASTRRSAQVVDLDAFKARRARARRGTSTGTALPLFDGQPAPATRPVAAETPGDLAPPPSLSERQVRHRERMLRFLSAGASVPG